MVSFEGKRVVPLTLLLLLILSAITQAVCYTHHPQAANMHLQQEQSATQTPGHHQRGLHGVDGKQGSSPLSDAEVERIMRDYRYVEDCNICHECVLTHLVARHAKAQARLKQRGLKVVQTSDPDIILEVPDEEGVENGDEQGAEEQREGQQHSSREGGAWWGWLSWLWGAVGTRRLPSSNSEASQAQPQQQQQQQAQEQASHYWPQEEEQPQQQVGGHHQWVSASKRIYRGINSPPRIGPKGRGVLPSQRRRPLALLDGIYTAKGVQIDISGVAHKKYKEVLAKRAKLPECAKCWGCTHTLQNMATSTKMNGSTYTHEAGGSSSWLFRVASDRVPSGQAVVKVACITINKHKWPHKPGCTPQTKYDRIKLLLAQQKLTTECGLSDIVPKVWVAPVNGIIPGHGYHVNWLGLWAEAADGVSVANLGEGWRPQDKRKMLDLFQNKLNHTELKLAALFDLFTSQCDRHPQNYFLNGVGKLWAIDNDQVYGTCWRPLGVLDSIVLPTTQKFMIRQLGAEYVDKVNRNWRRDWSMVSLMDYRCHTRNGTIGFNFPPKMRQCMSRLRAMDPADITAEYGFPDTSMSLTYKNRSSDLLTHGFEWTLKYGAPLNPPPHRYKMASACCKMAYKQSTQSRHSLTLVCVDPKFKTKMRRLPYGDPSSGGDWNRPIKDPGSYVGGSEF